MSQTPPPPPPSGFDPGMNPKAAAKAAKAYAKASRPWYKKKRFIIPLALVVIALISTAAGGGSSDDGDKTANDNSAAADTKSTDTPTQAASDDKTTKADEPKETKKAEPKKSDSKKPQVSADAMAIVSEFKDNELSADQKYKGKVIAVTGKVDKIDTEIFDDKDYVLKLKGDEYGILTVDCFDIPNEKLSKLSTGQTVTMIGDFKDGGDLGVELNHCVLK